MYGYIGAGLMGLFILMVLPAGMDNIQEDGKFYGAANLLVRDASGNELFTQTVHNRLLDTGENYIVNQTFVGGPTLGLDNSQMSAICVTNVTTVSETDTAATFSRPLMNLNGTNHCLVSTPNLVGDGQVILGPLQFTGGANIGPGETIRSIAICSNNDDAGNYPDCDDGGSNPIAFAAIVTSSVQLGATETVDVTYTFDLRSPDN